MTDAEPDTRLKINIKPYGDGIWVASSPAKPKMEMCGITPEDALERFVCEIQNDAEKEARVKSGITGVSAVIEIYIPENHALAEFGIGGEEIPAPEIPTVQTYGETHIHIDPGCMQAVHDAAAKIREKEDEGEETPSSETTVTAPITCRTCQSFHEARIGLGRNWCDTTMLDAQGDDAACEQYEAELVTDMANRIRSRDPVFGLSMKRDATNRLGTTSEEWVLLPANTTHTPQPGTRVLVYETGKTKAFVGKFIVGESKQLERDAAITDEWLFKLHATSDDIAARYGTAFRATAVEVCNYREFFLPIPVPADEKAPRGLTWLPSGYLLKLFPEASGK